LVALLPLTLSQTSPMSIYGAWHCSDDECTWATVRNVTEFDSKNHWLIDRGDGKPSVNLVIFSFVNPLQLLNAVNDSTHFAGIPIGMTTDLVNYFRSKDIRVMFSIGGITYVNDWNTALGSNATKLADNAANVALHFNVGMEIDYEESGSPNVKALDQFVARYRERIPYDASGKNPAARLTIDLAAGDRWLNGLCQKATADWLNTTVPMLDYANAMVPSKQPSNAAEAQSNWQEHIDGEPTYAPPIPPLAAAKFTGSLFITDSKNKNPIPECNNFFGSLEDTTGPYVTTVTTKAGKTNGMLGLMFWAAECPSTKSICTTPPNDCTKGVGTGSTKYNIAIPMAPLRQE